MITNQFIYMNKIFMFCIVAVCFAACNDNNNTTEVSSYKVNKDTVTISDSSPILNKLQRETVTNRSFEYELSTSGIVKAIPNNYALVAAPFAGRITKSFVRLGQQVSAGTPIFEISSPSYFETGKAYYQTKEEMDLALKNLNRQKDLLTKGVGVQKDLEEAQVNYAIKKQDFENASASLKVFQVNPSDLVLGEPLIVRSPIKGQIVENNIVIGQYIKEDSDPIATVAELSKIWISGQVKEKDIRYLTDSSEVEITPVSFPEKVIKGKIYHINSIIDEDTRSVQVLIECDNSNNNLKPGMYVTAKFIHNIQDVIVIPSEAVFQMNDASYVFIHHSGNIYIKQKIGIVTENTDSVIINSGLSSGDEILTNGGFLLLEEK